MTRPCLSRLRRPAFSLLEVVFSTLLVSVLMLGATNMLGAIARGRGDTSDRQRAAMLAEQLLAEILSLPYEDPELGGATFGPEAGEVTGSRALFDDVDDYHNWSKSPPDSKTGVAYGELGGWRRRVEVHFVSHTGPNTTVVSDQGLKRIRVTVERNGIALVTANGLKAKI